MIFNQWTYYLLLFVSVVLFFLLPKSLRRVVIIFSGVIFYANFAGIYIFLITIISLILYFIWCFQIPKGFLLSLVLTVAVLAYFKYAGFFLPVDKGIMPLGISFFTFEFIHLLIEVKRKKIGRPKFLQLFSFIFFFPTLVAGPIKRFAEFDTQIDKVKLTVSSLIKGIIQIVLGTVKKTIFADTFTTISGNLLTSMPEIHNASPYMLWVSLFAYSGRIFFDFSGYSDIAIGSSRLFGIKIPKNFDYPYLQTNIAQFWKHWHISLYQWIIDYIYIPLGGSRRSFWIACRNTFIAMTISGIWHGAAANFVLWGMYHGLLLVLYRGYKKIIPTLILPKMIQIPVTILSILTTFTFVTLGWLLFISPLDIAFTAFRKMIGL